MFASIPDPFTPGIGMWGPIHNMRFLDSSLRVWVDIVRMVTYRIVPTALRPFTLQCSI